MAKYPTLQTLAEASVQEITTIFRSLGLYYRGQRLSEIARAIVEDPICRGEIPEEERKLLQFRGIGKYIAKSICANSYDQPVAVLDTNVVRILQRFFGLVSRRKRPRDDPYFWEMAQKIAPSNDIRLWNLTLIDFGAIICTYRNPRCTECPVRQQCKYFSLKEWNK